MDLSKSLIKRESNSQLTKLDLLKNMVTGLKKFKLGNSHRHKNDHHGHDDVDSHGNDDHHGHSHDDR